ncbi:PepSY-associated TM helix domain-containing protein [Flavobacterium sp. AS60]|uniref:PepSY-associated TM helix domain-containing protein n=1 Tax=Flavobacterium anseongense TaxID=2910677 RepID=UPI001F39787D|nr:PepSY-associated TM helix domain-containing protein [Flavobacterium sp. AS60]MCF6128755.1 PepSY-associated TM helix domain-containing protein [Flavobacterium sp. AS60]
MKQATIRNLHRDLGYFYIGLIISFAFSGILMNHRESWHPEKYTIETKAIEVKLPAEEKINEPFADSLGKALGIDDKIRRHNIKKGTFKISFEKHDVEIDMETGKGEIVSFQKTPIISQMMKLHKNTSNWWIYYGDIFGISLIVIAITGSLMISAGKFSFKNRGWKLALAGIIFPLLILLFV